MYSKELGCLETPLKMLKAKSGFSALTINSKVFVIGGNDGHILNKCEVLDLETEEWTALSRMKTKRDELACVVGPDGMIYAIGGYGG